MPSLPDIPGKSLVTEAAQRARAIAGAAGNGALAVGGGVAKRVLGGKGDGEDSGVPQAAKPKPPKPAKAKPAPKPKAKPGKPKPAAKPKRAPKPPKRDNLDS